jgi:hypothetical protein
MLEIIGTEDILDDEETLFVELPLLRGRQGGRTDAQVVKRLSGVQSAVLPNCIVSRLNV